MEGIHYAEPTDSYLLKPAEVPHRQPHQHEKTCSRYDGRRQSRRRLTGLETSITSLHSSGKDSGIVDGVDVMRCQCGHSSTHSSEESSK